MLFFFLKCSQSCNWREELMKVILPHTKIFGNKLHSLYSFMSVGTIRRKIRETVNHRETYCFPIIINNFSLFTFKNNKNLYKLRKKISTFTFCVRLQLCSALQVFSMTILRDEIAKQSCSRRMRA